MGVNDLAEQFRGGGYDDLACSQEMKYVARTAWHSMATLPTEEDGDDKAFGEVLLMSPAGVIMLVHHDEVEEEARPFPELCRWARIRDVVLLPPE